MKTRKQILFFLKQNKNLFRDKFHIIRIGIFGSYARGDQNINSALICLLSLKKIPMIYMNLNYNLKTSFVKICI
jgi:predicted nucleotidyltransferase